MSIMNYQPAGESGIQTSLSIEHQLDRLALEASFLSNVAGIFKTTIPGIAAKLRDYATAFNSSTPDLAFTVKESKILEEKVQGADFASYRGVLVNVPEGFQGELIEYIRFLNQMSPAVTTGANKLLGEYNFVLSSFISNKENKTALKDHTAFYKRVQQEREALNSDLSQWFKGPNHQSKTGLDKVIKRFSDIIPLIKETNNLVKVVTNDNLKQIKRSVDQSLELLEIIVNDVETNGIANVSGEAALNISKGAYELGKMVEFVSIYHFRVEQAVNASKDLSAVLKKVL